MDEILVCLGKRISYLRNKKGLTQEKLAELVRRSTNHISKLELARCNPSFELLVEISKALNIDLKELFDFEKPKPVVDIKKEFQSLINSSDDKKIQLLYKIYSSLE